MTRPLVLAVALSAIVATGAAAHHSFAMYDATRPVTLRGHVTQVRWVSPHAVFSIATDATPPVVWTIELSSPANMTRLGWSHSTLKVGDRLEVVGSPMRDGTHGAACRQLKFVETGKMLECAASAAINVGEKTNTHR